MNRESLTLKHGFAAKTARGNQLIWRSERKPWEAKRGDKSILVLPGHYADSKEQITFIRAAFPELTKTFPGSEDGRGNVGESLVLGDWTAINTLAGYPATPLTYMPVTNRSIIADMELPTGFIKSRHKQIWDEFFKLMWSTATEASIPVPDISTSGFPFFVNSSIEKMGIVEYVLKNAEEIVDLVNKGDFVRLAKDHGVVMAFYMGMRGQNESVQKERLINDYLFAITGGLQGERIPANKIVEIDGQVIEGFGRQRSRTVAGMSFAINLIINAFMYPIMKAFYNRFSFTYKHTTKEQQELDENKYTFTVHTDVTQFDQTVQRWHVHYWADFVKSNGLMSDRIVDFIVTAHTAPYFQPSVDGIQPGRWVGNALKDNRKVTIGGEEIDRWYALMSGIATVSPFGKAFMTPTYLCWLDDVYGDVLEVGIAKILAGEHPHYAIKNAGDDNKTLINDLTKYDQLTQHATKVGATYFKFEVEKAGSFVGRINAIRTGSNRKELLPKIQSAFNFFIPEKDFGSKLRPYAGRGYFDRDNIYNEHPGYQEFKGIINYAWKKAYPNGNSIDAIIDKYNQSTEYLMYTSKLEPRTYADLIVMLDPSKIHYSIDPDDVSPEILDSLIKKIPYERFSKLFEDNFGGKFVSTKETYVN